MKKWKTWCRSFLSTFFSLYRSAELDLTGVAVAYYLLISLFPIMMTLASLLPYLPINSQQILAALEDFFPSKLYPSLAHTVTDLLTQPSHSLLGLSLVTTLWSISKSMTALQKAINKAYGIREHRDFIIGHAVGMLLGIGLQLVILLSVTLLAFGQGLAQLVRDLFGLENDFLVSLLGQGQTLAYLVLFCSLLLLYFFLPNVRIKKIGFVLPGACFVLLTFVTLGRLFSWYVASYTAKLIDFRFASSLVFLVFILWFVFLANVLIIGALINASVQSLEVEEFAPRKGDLASVLNHIKAWFTPLE